MAASFTYDVETLATVAVARVRRTIGDVDVSGGATTAEFADQEIEFAIASKGDETSASIELLNQLATKYARAATVATGSQRINLSDISKAYERRVEELRNNPDGVDGSALASMAVTRIDGYSQDIASDAVLATDSTDPNGRREHYDWPVG